MAALNHTTPNIQALSVLISEITDAAYTVNRLCVEAINIGAEDIHQQAACIAGARELANLIGWKSDKATELLQDDTKVKDSAENWLLSPAYHSAIVSAEVGHG